MAVAAAAVVVVVVVVVSSSSSSIHGKMSSKNFYNDMSVFLLKRMATEYPNSTDYPSSGTQHENGITITYKPAVGK